MAPTSPVSILLAPAGDTLAGIEYGLPRGNLSDLMGNPLRGIEEFQDKSGYVFENTGPR
jgi:hypothetical protein